MVVVFAIAGLLIAPYDPYQTDLLIGITRPSTEHWLGTDDLGRDVLSRTIVGARTALVGPALVALGAMLIGSVLGVFAGYRGGRWDALVMRWVELMYALPGLLVAIVVVGVLGGGYARAVALLVVLTAPYDTRLIRGATLEQRNLAYVEAAEVLGLPRRNIMFRQIWPNLAPIVVANTFLTFAFALVALAALSFLGLGVGPGTADWGRMLSDSRVLLFENPWTAFAPAAMLVLTAVSMNLLGDWAYERLSDRGRSR
jgi:peptide/nickel transport system permease protein